MGVIKGNAPQFVEHSGLRSIDKIVCSYLIVATLYQNIKKKEEPVALWQ
ncbi:MAG: hypothetical protein GX488_01075 [Clostridiales bacterium]|nr:hypothetical protein [Clostridiales bacterium]